MKAAALAIFLPFFPAEEAGLLMVGVGAERNECQPLQQIGHRHRLKDNIVLAGLKRPGIARKAAFLEGPIGHHVEIDLVEAAR